MHLSYKMKVENALIAFSNILFVGLYCILAIHNRYAKDDFFYWDSVQNNGVLQTVAFQYNHWCSRFFSVAINCFILSISPFQFKTPIYSICILALFVLANYCVIRAIANKKNVVLTPFEALNFSIFLCICFFFGAFHIGETWFWLASSTTYLLSTIMSLFLLPLLMKQNPTKKEMFIVIILSLYIGGANEMLSFVLMLIMSTIALTNVFKSNLLIFIRLSKPQLNLLYWSIISMLFTLAFVYFSPGVKLRSTFFEEISVLEAIIINFKMSYRVLKKTVLYVLPALLIFSIPVVYLIHIKFTPQIKSPFLTMLFSSLSGLIFIYIFQLPITYKTVDLAANRTLYPLTIIFFVLGVIFLIAFFQIVSSSSLSKNLALLSLWGIVCFNLYQVQNQYRLTKKYSKAYDERMILLKNLSNKNMDEIYLNPLPNSGWLFSAEIDPNGHHFVNYHLMNALGITTTLKLKKPKPSGLE